MQPMRDESSSGAVQSAAAIGSAAFAAMAQKEVPADSLIFHKWGSPLWLLERWKTLTL